MSASVGGYSLLIVNRCALQLCWGRRRSLCAYQPLVMWTSMRWMVGMTHNNPCFTLFATRQWQCFLLIPISLVTFFFGGGRYLQVKDAIDLITLRRCAIKIISKFGVRKIPYGWSQALMEASVMRHLPPNRQIVSFHCSLLLPDPDRLCIVMEHCLGSVHDLQAAGVPSIGGDEFCFDSQQQQQQQINKHRRESVCPIVVRSPSEQDVPTPQRKFSDRIRLPLMMNDVVREQAQKLSDAMFRRRKISNIETVSNQKRREQAHAAGASSPQQKQFRRLPEAQARAYFLQVSFTSLCVFLSLTRRHTEPVRHPPLSVGVRGAVVVVEP